MIPLFIVIIGNALVFYVLADLVSVCGGLRFGHDFVVVWVSSWQDLELLYW